MGQTLASQVESLHRHAAARPDEVAVTFLVDGDSSSVHWTYSQLLQRALAIAETLRPHAGGRALLVHPPGLEFIAALYACWLAGVVAVPTPLPKFSRNNRAALRFAALVRDADPALALTTSDRLSQAIVLCRGTPGLEALKWVATDAPTDAAVERADPDSAAAGFGAPALDALAMIQYTSGSTGTPRGVMLTHGNLVANQAAIQAKFQHTTESRMVSWLPLHHDMGLIGGILQPLSVGFPVLLMDAAHFMQRPLRWLRAISDFRGTTSGGPDFAYRLCANALDDRVLGTLDLSSWELAFTGAEPVKASTLRLFSERLAACGFRPQAFYPCYGLAEATLLVTGGSKSALPVTFDDGAAGSVGCGSACDDHHVQVVSAQGNPCPTGQVGEIWVSGPSVARGYWNRPEETAASFEAQLNGTSPAGPSARWLRTGDLGCLREGELVVMGRLKDLIILRGRNVYPQDLEEVASACHPAIGASVAFSVDADEGERLVIVAEIRREVRSAGAGDRALQTLHAVVGREFDLHVHQAILVSPGALLRTTSGKLRRAACRDAYLAGTWTVHASVARDAFGDAYASSILQDAAAVLAPCAPEEQLRRVRQYLTRRTAQVLGVPVAWLAPECSLGDLGVDSLMRVELLLQLESDLGCELGTGVVHADASLDLLAQAIQRICSSPATADAAWPAEPEELPGGDVPLSPVQLEFLGAGMTHPEKFHTMLYLRVPAGTDMERLEAAVRGLDARFEALRARFHRRDGAWRQCLGAVGTGVSFSRLDMTQARGQDVRATAVRLHNTLHEGFDLQSGPLVQAVWLDAGGGKPGSLVLAIHHLVTDGASIAVLLVALERAYRLGAVPGRPQTQGITYPDWARRIDAFAQSAAVRADLPHWRATCGVAGAAQSGTNPHSWATVARQVDPSVTQALLEDFPSSAAQHDLFLACLARAWGIVSGESRVLVRLESHGRHPLADGAATAAPVTTVGWMTSRHPVAIDLHDGESFPALLKRVQDTVRQVPNHGLSYGLLMHSCADEATRAEMAGLAVPRLGMVFRSRLDHGFRADAQFPVFLVHHINQAELLGDKWPTLMLEVGRSNTALTWRIVHDVSAHQEALVSRLVEVVEAQIAGWVGSKRLKG